MMKTLRTRKFAGCHDPFGGCFALIAVFLAACGGGEPELCRLEPRPPPSAASSNTRVVYLLYADGETSIPHGELCQGQAVPPAFTCTYGGAQGTRGCQVAVQEILDVWFSAFDVVFTNERPPSEPFQTVVVTGDGAWCGVPSGVGGRAEFDCTDERQGVAYAFRCGDSAAACANIIAQEYAHLLGLEHVLTRTDVMGSGLCSEHCAGFEDVDYPIAGASLCNFRLQNSHARLLERLGPWIGETPKPSPIHCDSLPR